MTTAKEASRIYLRASDRIRYEKMIESSQCEAKLYGRETIEFFHWPETQAGDYAKRFLMPLIQQGIGLHIKNVHAEVYALKVDQHVLPLVEAKEDADNSYVCSPYGHYFGNFAQSAHLVNIPLIAPLIRLAIKGIGQLLRNGRINAAVYVNNWLFSTDLYPEGISSKQISGIVETLTEQFPGRAIIFRSLNHTTNSSLLKSLSENGFKMMASRQIFLTNSSQEELFNTRILKSDLKLWRENSHKVTIGETLSSEDRATCLKLYNSLYLDHHCNLSPQFTARHFQQLIDQKLLNFIVLREEGQIKGVAGFFERDGVMLCPFFGYEKEAAGHQIVYRLLSTTLLLEARSRKLVFHQSSGASFYKKVRRAKASMESMAVYTAHLPLSQKLTWAIFRSVINLFAPRFMKKY
jgi:hypothetical protein